MTSHSVSSKLSDAITTLSEAIAEEKPSDFFNVAESLLTLCEEGKTTEKFLPVYLVYSALSYEIAGEPLRMLRPYTKLLKSPVIPIDESLHHKGILKNFNEFLYYFGKRSVFSAIEKGTLIFQQIKDLQKNNDQRFSNSNDDETITFLGILETFLSYLENTEKQDLKSLSELAKYCEKFSEKLKVSDSSPWLNLLAKLSIHTINSAVQRNILHLKIPKPIVTQLIQDRRVELWQPQQKAVESGILNQENILLTMRTSGGKTFLSTLTGAFASPQKKVVMLSPTRTLSYETYQTIKKYMAKSDVNVALSTKETTEYDESLSQFSVISATYEKFSSLFRRNLIAKEEIKSIIIDEFHYISDEDRGIPLEFLINNLRQSSTTQIVGLSGMINPADAEKLTAWIKGKNVSSEWRPLDLDETVLYDGKYYHKDGRETDSPIGVSRTLLSESKRFSLTRGIAMEEIVNGRQCMIVIPSRTKIEQESEKMTQVVFGRNQLFPDENNNQLKPGRESYSNKIRTIEPELPPFAISLAKMIENGIAYHHAGLPERYRHIVEDAVREKVVRILFTTTTFEAGVNLPVSTIIFPNPSARVSKFSGKMSVNRYKNIAGRAGRPGFDKTGKSILIALNKEEKEDYFENFILSDANEVKSSIQYFLNYVPTSRYAIHSEILNILSEKRKLTKPEILSEVKDTWFLKTAEQKEIQKFEWSFSNEIDKLSRYGCIEQHGDQFSIGKMGEVARNSMLYAFSISSIVINLRRILSTLSEGKEYDILILSLVGLPWELRNYDEIMQKVKISKEVAFVKKIIKNDYSHLGEKYERAEFAPKFATVLWYWINSVSTTEIIEKCGIYDSHSAFIEETLKEDAYWILNSIARISDKTVKLKDWQRERIKNLAEYCKIGSSDPLVKDIMQIGLEHVFRSTAIKLSKYFKEKSKQTVSIKDLQEIPQKSFLELFPENKTSAEVLFEEIQSRSNKNYK